MTWLAIVQSVPLNDVSIDILAMSREGQRTLGLTILTQKRWIADDGVE